MRYSASGRRGSGSLRAPPVGDVEPIFSLPWWARAIRASNPKRSVTFVTLVVLYFLPRVLHPDPPGARREGRSQTLLFSASSKIMSLLRFQSAKALERCLIKLLLLLLLIVAATTATFAVLLLRR